MIFGGLDRLDGVFDRADSSGVECASGKLPPLDRFIELNNQLFQAWNCGASGRAVSYQHLHDPPGSAFASVSALGFGVHDAGFNGLLEVVFRQCLERAHTDRIAEHRVGRSRYFNGGQNLRRQRLNILQSQKVLKGAAEVAPRSSVGVLSDRPNGRVERLLVDVSIEFLSSPPNRALAS
jgi:hypothetical protein